MTEEQFDKFLSMMQTQMQAQTAAMQAQADPSKVAFTSGYGVYRIHVLFPEGRITLIERDFEGTNYEYPQDDLYGMPGVRPTHFGGGIRSQHYAVKDRHSYFDNILVSFIPEPAFPGLLALAGLFFVRKQR